ncbi:hypothetical protein AVEN_203813-1 [Araneus ventricosus]|uniref:Uncharacterized protein n=1 Tax=Araneus ventricosus TaxID=182803 RepID=A0A4Y2T0G8_ARAVE|nr:hypothetical protein AVEN_203813-1 [Araneus ventricosus]
MTGNPLTSQVTNGHVVESIRQRILKTERIEYPLQKSSPTGYKIFPRRRRGTASPPVHPLAPSLTAPVLDLLKKSRNPSAEYESLRLVWNAVHDSFITCNEITVEFECVGSEEIADIYDFYSKDVGEYHKEVDQAVRKRLYFYILRTASGSSTVAEAPLQIYDTISAVERHAVVSGRHRTNWSTE